MEWTALGGFYGLPPNIIRKEYYVVLEVWDAREELAPLQKFLRQQTKKRGRRRSCVRGAEGVDVGESVLYLFFLRLVLLPHHLVKGGPPMDGGRSTMK